MNKPKIDALNASDPFDALAENLEKIVDLTLQQLLVDNSPDNRGYKKSDLISERIAKFIRDAKPDDKLCYKDYTKATELPESLCSSCKLNRIHNQAIKEYTANMESGEKKI